MQILVGTYPNDGSGENDRAVYQKINQYGILNDKTVNAAFFKTASNTWEAAINLAIPAAALLGPGAAVWIPASGLPYNASLVTFNTAVKMLREGGVVGARWDVKAYGAYFDGATDDTSAWTAMFTGMIAAGGGVAEAPAGTSNATSWPTFTKPILIVGQPGNVTIVHFSSTATCTKWDWTGLTPATNQYSYGPGLRDIVLDGPGSGTTSVGIELGGPSGCQGFFAQGVQVQGFGTGVRGIDNAYLFTFSHCMLRQCGQVLLGQTGVSNAGENCRFYGCTFANANPLGADVSIPAGSPFQFRFTDCSFDGVQVSIAAGEMTFTNCHFENPGTPGNYEFISQTGGDIEMYLPEFRMNDTRTISQFVHVTGGKLSAFGTRASSQSAGMPQVYYADTSAVLLLFGTTVLFNVLAEFAENGFHTATYVGSWGCVNGFGNANVVTADQGDASTAWTYGTTAQIINFNTPLTVNRTYTLNHAGTCAGARVRVKRTAAATGAFTLTVQNQVPTAIKVLAVGQWGDFVFNGVSNAWELEAFGSL